MGIIKVGSRRAVSLVCFRILYRIEVVASIYIFLGFDFIRSIQWSSLHTLSKITRAPVHASYCVTTGFPNLTLFLAETRIRVAKESNIALVVLKFLKVTGRSFFGASAHLLISQALSRNALAILRAVFAWSCSSSSLLKIYTLEFSCLQWSSLCLSLASRGWDLWNWEIIFRGDFKKLLWSHTLTVHHWIRLELV